MSRDKKKAWKENVFVCVPTDLVINQHVRSTVEKYILQYDLLPVSL